jgi:putative ABC transport system permease protein
MIRDLLLRLRSLVRRDVVDAELDDELQFHLERQVDSYMRNGLSRAEAVRRARIEFGGLDEIREAHRDARGVRLLLDLGRDVRFAVRQLRRSPSFAIAALLCLALGIGATTAIFSVVNTILLRPLPYTDSDRLVRLSEYSPSSVPGRPPNLRAHTLQEFLDWRSETKTLTDGIAMGGVGQRLVRTPQGVVGLWGAVTSPNAFKVLGVPVLLGRTFSEADVANPDVVVLSFQTWRTYFNRDPAVVGRTLEFRGGALTGSSVTPKVMTVVGVLTATDMPSASSDFYWPIVGNLSGGPRVTMIFRLSPGVSQEAAHQEANVIGAAMRARSPEVNPLSVPRFAVERLRDRAVQNIAPALRVFLAAVVVVLIIVCANIANLLLARGTARQREIAVRFAIGASRMRVIRQMMTESLVLAIAGGALGAILGATGVSMIKQLATVEAPGIYRLMFGTSLLPRANEITVDFRMLVFSLGLAIITSVVFGALPALTLSRSSHASSTRARISAGHAESRLRAALVVSQLVMATILLVSAGLLANSFIKLSRVNNGYDPSNVLAFNLLFPDQYSIARKAETIDRLLTRFRNSADVRSVGFSRHGLLMREELFLGNWVPPGRSREEMRNLRTRVRSVSGDYLTAMGVPLLEGRYFDTRNDAGTQPVVVISRSAARQYFGAASPVGRTLDWYFVEQQARPMTVIGVVEDIRQESPTDEVFPEIFVDYRQLLSVMNRGTQPEQRQNELAIGFLSFAIRTTGDPASAVPEVRQIVSDVDSDVGIDAIVPMSRLSASAVARERFYAVMLGSFAALAGVLAAIGVYGVLTYAVIQRTQEIGIRMAIGAQREAVLALVLRKGLVLTSIGLTVGLVGASIGTRALQGMLFGITPLDPVTFVVVPLLFGLVAAFAAYLPARRATNIDALVALRSE